MTNMLSTAVNNLYQVRLPFDSAEIIKPSSQKMQIISLKTSSLEPHSCDWLKFAALSTKIVKNY